MKFYGSAVKQGSRGSGDPSGHSLAPGAKVRSSREDLGEVKGRSVTELSDLFAATEAVGDDQVMGRSGADGRKEFQFADRHGDIVFVRFEAE